MNAPRCDRRQMQGQQRKQLSGSKFPADCRQRATDVDGTAVQVVGNSSLGCDILRDGSPTSTRFGVIGRTLTEEINRLGNCRHCCIRGNALDRWGAGMDREQAAGRASGRDVVQSLGVDLPARRTSATHVVRFHFMRWMDSMYWTRFLTRMLATG